MNNLKPANLTYWYIKKDLPELLTENKKTDVVVVGGGMAGISAAQEFSRRGLSVILLEKTFCGGGASGKSSGFITANSELGVAQFTKSYGTESAKKIWSFDIGGQELIRTNIEELNLSCDFQEQDTIMVANSESQFENTIKPEFAALKDFGFSTSLYKQSELMSYINSDKYYGGVSYLNTFGINGYQYCQEMKRLLKLQKVQIYEETAVIKVASNYVQTEKYKVFADNIILCVDRFLPDLNLIPSKVFNVQTFLLVSKPLSQQQIKKIFPQKNLMVWDTDMVYQYYRINGDNRLIVGGSGLFSSYVYHEQYNKFSVYKKLSSYMKYKFPDVDLQFEYMWPGLLGVSKDLAPIAGFDKDNKKIYYISAATGLTWAAALGRYSASAVLDNNDEFSELFSPYRKFPIGDGLQKILGKRITFALSNFWSM